jgi:release factor glutamine methyltransferase
MSDGTISWGALWDEAARRVPRTQARWLCEVASGRDGDEFLEILEQPATQGCVAHLHAMLVRLDAGEPLQYVLGRWGFRHLDLMIDRRVLIPRPETETLVEIALGLARSMRFPIMCADLGTGSGAIGLSLAAELPIEGVTVWMTDRSSDALDVARANAAGIGRAGANVRVAQGEWFDALPHELRGQLAIVVSNPPYVSADDRDLEPIVRDWEPPDALFGGIDGLDEIRQLVGAAPLWLRPGGWLIIETGASHGDRTIDLFHAAGFGEISVRRDLTDRDRIAVGRWPATA